MTGDAFAELAKVLGVPAVIAVFLVWHLNSNFNTLLKQVLAVLTEANSATRERNAVQREDADAKAKVATELSLLRQELWNFKDRFEPDRKDVPRS